MKRVEIVNLGGHARHIESDGAAAIDAWLDTARVRLNGDPDREDLLLDFERAIGEKCDAQVADGHEVVTTEEIAAILESLGTIEPSGDDEAASLGSASPHLEERARRLYRLPGERMIAGVCSGVAAWMRVDVTVVRLVWVVVPIVLAGFTDGASLPLSVALYALLAFVLPRADSPEARAAAHGHGATAQDRLMQARSGAMPALTHVGSRLGVGIRIAARGLRILLLLAITAVLAVWVVGAGWLAVAGDPLLTAFGDDFSSWLVPLFLTCVAVILVAPLTAIVAIIDYGIRGRTSAPEQRGRLTIWLLSATAAWVAAITVAAFIVWTIPGVRDVSADGEGRIFFDGTTYCFVAGRGDAHCEPGDQIVGGSEWDDMRLVPNAPSAPTASPLPTAPSLPTAPALPTLPETPTPAAPAN